MNTTIKYIKCDNCGNKIEIHMVENPSSKKDNITYLCDCENKISVTIPDGWFFMNGGN